MKRFLVNFSVDKCYDIVVEAENAEEAARTVTEGRYDVDDEIPAGEEFLNVNNVTELEQ